MGINVKDLTRGITDGFSHFQGSFDEAFGASIRIFIFPMLTTSKVAHICGPCTAIFGKLLTAGFPSKSKLLLNTSWYAEYTI